MENDRLIYIQPLANFFIYSAINCGGQNGRLVAGGPFYYKVRPLVVFCFRAFVSFFDLEVFGSLWRASTSFSMSGLKSFSSVS